MVSAIRNISYDTPCTNGKTKLNVVPCILFLCMFTDVRFFGALGNLGGHALFASLFELKALWHYDIIITQLLETIIEKCENPPISVTM